MVSWGIEYWQKGEAGKGFLWRDTSSNGLFIEVQENSRSALR